MQAIIRLFRCLCTLCALGLLAFSLSANAGIEHPTVKWRFKTQGAIRGGAVIQSGFVYFGSSDGQVYALDSNNGDLLWQFKTQGAIVAAPAINGKMLLVSSRDGNIYALDQTTGKLEWNFAMQQELPATYGGWAYFTAAPVIFDDMVYVGSGDGKLYALQLNNGKLTWQFSTPANIRATPKVTDKVIYQPSNNGVVYVLDRLSGQLQWQYDTDGVNLTSADFGFDRKSIYAQPILVGDVLLIASRDGNLYSINTNTHQKSWSFAYDTTWAMSTAVNDGRVYVGWSTNDLASAFDLSSGKELWHFKTDSHNYATPLVVKDCVYIASADGNLYQLDASTGEKHWAYNIGDELNASPVYDDKNNALLLGSDDGYFYALQQGKPAHKAVYMADDTSGVLQYLVADKKIAPYLGEHDYSILNGPALTQFVQDRIRDHEPSVIVFALLLIPHDVMGEDPATGLLSQYLQAGGKVLWFGDVPNYFQPDTDGNIKPDANAGSKLLGVEFSQLSESGNYSAHSTQAGLNWGLPPILTTTATPVKQQDIIPLAFDEFNRVSAFVKNYTDQPGRGYVSLRTWGWYTPIRLDDLELIDKVASYGLE